MPTMALQRFFGWDLNLPFTGATGPTFPSYAAWQTSVITFSFLWLLLAPGATPIARLALAYLQLGFTAGDWELGLDDPSRSPNEELTPCAVAL
jgi:hypothetical protein